MISNDQRSPIASRVLATGHSLLFGGVSSIIFPDLGQLGLGSVVLPLGIMWLQFETYYNNNRFLNETSLAPWRCL
jgi:hypothetical protein